MSWRAKSMGLTERYALLLLGIAIFVFFTVDPSTPQFATGANLKNILSSQAALGILVIASMIPLIAGHIDLSVGPGAGLCSLLCAGMMSKSGLPLLPAIAVAVLGGVAIGVVNGLLVARVGINSIVATLGTSSVIGALVLWYSSGVSIITGISPKLTNIGSGHWLGLPKQFWFLVVVVLVAYYVLERRPIGRHLYAAGSSPRAAELVGLPVPRLTMLSFVSAGALAGLTGVLLVGIQGSGNPALGPSFTLPAIAAVFLGATAISPGRYNVVGAMVAIFLLAISVNGLTLLGAADWVSDMFNGVALLIGVGISVYSGRRRATRSADAARPPTDANLLGADVEEGTPRPDVVV